MAGMLGNILWGRQRKWQYFSAGGGLVISLILVMMALQIYHDLDRLMDKREGTRNDYIIINKRVSELSNLGEGSRFSAIFNENDQAKISETDFILDWAPIEVSRFNIYSNLADKLDIYADLFFEAVPEKFLDTIPKTFHWQEGDQKLPIILSKDFLDIYNFNVAGMYGSPQFSAETVKQIPFEVVISGNGQQKRFQAQVVGFSYRYPSIMVPQRFLSYANKNFSGTDPKNPNRLVLEVEDASSEQLQHFLADNKYEANREQLFQKSFKIIVQVVYSLAAIIGLIIAILSIILFIVTSELMISRVKEKISLLISLGYSPKMISGNFIRHFLIVMLICTVIAAVFFGALNWWFHNWLSSKGIEIDHFVSWMAVTAGLSLLLITITLNYLSVRSRLT